MNAADHRRPAAGEEAIRETARTWIVRRDRGLTDEEASAFSAWLAADPRHAAAVTRSENIWLRLDRISPEVAARALAGRGRTRWRTWMTVSLAAAAALALAVAWWRPVASRPVRAESAPVESPQLRVTHLSDGTTVLLNAGSEVSERFTPAERRVELVRGEANFEVTKNPARPFIVRAGNVEIRAVGTAFDVNLRPAAVEVLVTEGRVSVLTDPMRAAAAGAAPPGPNPPLVHSAQRAVVALTPDARQTDIQIAEMNLSEIARALEWQKPLIKLGGATLAEIAAAFERNSGHRLILADPELADLRVGGRFRRNDMQGFVRVLEEHYGVTSEIAADGTIVLHKPR